MRIVVIGPAGSGKTSVGRKLAERLSATFVDADHLHSAESVARMTAGLSLTDADRGPWLAAVGDILAATDRIVVACSALTVGYRAAILDIAPDAVFVALDVPPMDLAVRMSDRVHFMPVTLLESQLATWEPLRSEEPGGSVDGTGSVEEVVMRVASALAIALTAERPERADGRDTADGRDESDEAQNQV